MPSKKTKRNEKQSKFISGAIDLFKKIDSNESNGEIIRLENLKGLKPKFVRFQPYR